MHKLTGELLQEYCIPDVLPEEDWRSEAGLSIVDNCLVLYFGSRAQMKMLAI